MAAKPEVKVKAMIDKALANLGFYVLVKPIGGQYGEAGVSDLLLCYQGIFIALEVKSEANGKNRPTPLQSKFLRRVRDAGGLVAVVDESNVDGLVPWIKAAVADPSLDQTYLNREDALTAAITKVEL